MTRKIGKQNRWRKAVNDPVLFCREFLEFEPHKGQAEWLENSNRSQNLLVTGNRWGKSLIEAAKIIHPSSATRNSTPGMALPMLPARGAAIGLSATTPPSVRP